MGRAHYDDADFLGAARDIAVARGPAAVTVSSVTERLAAPTGSFYHRFASRDVLLGELWLSAVRSFQTGFVAAIEAGDGLRAALHGAIWSRAHLQDACLLLLYHPDDFLRGTWPEALKQGVAAQLQQWEACIEAFARDAFGRASTKQLRLARFVLTDVPLAALRPHLQRRESPPPLVDELIRATYRAIVSNQRASKR